MSIILQFQFFLIPSVEQFYSIRHTLITKDFDVVDGKCTIEISSSGRSSDSTFNMLNTDEQFSFFNEIPELDAYGRSIPYFCEITVTKDHMWEMDYKIYDLMTGKLMDSHKGE
ncbi:hypothetical protein ABE042_03720 [Viridibacillus arvi]|uniref:hypothetical protein n=1 Tax=Viridibacillus arvi TaxID=263475 RepID=UPI003D27F4D2